MDDTFLIRRAAEVTRGDKPVALLGTLTKDEATQQTEYATRMQSRTGVSGRVIESFPD